MDLTGVFLKLLMLFTVVLLMNCVHETEAGPQKKKKLVIHIPVQNKVEKHVHTVIKHIHHHHKPIVVKAEKVIHEEHKPIVKKEHISIDHEHTHHHQEKHVHPVEIHHVQEELEEEHVHHHHNYEHMHKAATDSEIESDDEESP